VPNVAAQSLPFHEVISTKQEAPFYSCKAYDHAVVFADLQLKAEVAHRGDYANVKNVSTFSPLLQTKELALRKKAQGAGMPGAWLLTFGPLGGSSATAWPAKEEKIEGSALVVFAEDRQLAKTKLHWATLLVPSEWEACLFEWRSPRSQRIEFPGLRLAPVGIRRIQSSQVRDLLQLAARHAFFTIGRTNLVAICKGIEMDVDSTWSLYDLVWNMVKTVAGTPELPLSDEEIFDIMRLRVPHMDTQGDDMIDAFLDLDEGLSLLDRDEEKELRDEQHKQRNTRNTCKDYLGDLGKTRERLYPRPKPKAKAKGKAKAKAVAAPAQPRLPAEERPESRTLKLLLPPGASPHYFTRPD
jgi:hypothetical protein